MAASSGARRRSSNPRRNSAAFHLFGRQRRGVGMGDVEQSLQKPSITTSPARRSVSSAPVSRNSTSSSGIAPTNSCVTLDLPRPGSPTTKTVCPSPAVASCQARLRSWN